MDLYDDLPPAQGEGQKSWSGTTFKKEIVVKDAPNLTKKTTVTNEKAIFKPASLAFKPRQTNVAVSAQKTPGPTITPVVHAQMAAPIATETLSVSNPGLKVSEGSSDVTLSKEFNINTSFDVKDPYEPNTPNDYIKYCEERLERKKRILLEEDNRRYIEEQDQLRRQVEKDRAEAAQKGDYQSLLKVNMPILGVGATGQMEPVPMAAAGRGRGRGGAANLPAWMTQQLKAPTASTAEVTDSGSTSVSNQFADATSLPASTGTDTSPATVGVVGVRRKEKGAFSKPSCVLLLKNMVSADDVDDMLAPETQQECAKYGPVNDCVVITLPLTLHGKQCPPEERVYTFIEFAKQESAVRAFRDMNGRFFAGRAVAASFFDEDRFHRREYTPTASEVTNWP